MVNVSFFRCNRAKQGILRDCFLKEIGILLGFVIKKSFKIGKIGKMIHKRHLAIQLAFRYFSHSFLNQTLFVIFKHRGKLGESCFHQSTYVSLGDDPDSGSKPAFAMNFEVVIFSFYYASLHSKTNSTCKQRCKDFIKSLIKKEKRKQQQAKWDIWHTTQESHFIILYPYSFRICI